MFPSHPYPQLLSVLPPNFASLLPSKYASLITNPNSELGKLGIYPKTFKIDCEGKQKDYQCITLLPFTDHVLMRKAHESMMNDIETDSDLMTDYYTEYVSDVTLDPVKWSNSYGIVSRMRIEATQITT